MVIYNKTTMHPDQNDTVIRPEVLRPFDTSEVNDFIRRVFTWMSGGLLLTAIVAYSVANSPTVLNFIFGTPFLFIGLIVIEFILVIYLAGFVNKMSSSTAGIVFILYSIFNGLTLSAIFMIYALSSIGSVFVITAGMFAIISVYGFYTKRDLTTIGHIAFMGLIGILLASLVGLFFNTGGDSLIISYIAVVVFVLLTAYDTQKLKQINAPGILVGSETEKKASIIGALTLYLDFVNLFVRLLRIMGRRK